MLAKNLVQMDADGRCIVTTDLNTILSNETINIELLSPYNHEEADTRMFLHVKHAVEEGLLCYYVPRLYRNYGQSPK